MTALVKIERRSATILSLGIQTWDDANLKDSGCGHIFVNNYLHLRFRLNERHRTIPPSSATRTGEFSNPPPILIRLRRTHHRTKVQALRPIGVSTAAAAAQQAALILGSVIKRQNLSTASAPLSHAALHCAAFRSRASIGAGAAATAMAEARIMRALMSLMVKVV